MSTRVIVVALAITTLCACAATPATPAGHASVGTAVGLLVPATSAQARAIGVTGWELRVGRPGLQLAGVRADGARVGSALFSLRSRDGVDSSLLVIRAKLGARGQLAYASDGTVIESTLGSLSGAPQWFGAMHADLAAIHGDGVVPYDATTDCIMDAVTAAMTCVAAGGAAAGCGAGAAPGCGAAGAPGCAAELERIAGCIGLGAGGDPAAGAGGDPAAGAGGDPAAGAGGAGADDPWGADDPGAGDPGAGDPGAGDPGAGDPGAGADDPWGADDPGAGDPGADASGDDWGGDDSDSDGWEDDWGGDGSDDWGGDDWGGDDSGWDDGGTGGGDTYDV